MKQQPAADSSPANGTPRRRRGWRLIVGLAIVLLIVPVAGYYAFRIYSRINDRLSEVHAAHLWRAAQMPPAKLAKVCQDLGIRTVFDLREQDPGETHCTDEGAALAAVGVRYVHIPSDQVPDMKDVNRFLDIMDKPENRPALVHCKHGNGRTGVFAAVYRIEYQGWSNQNARIEAQLFGGLRAFSNSREKGVFLMNYVPRAARRKTPSHSTTAPAHAH